MRGFLVCSALICTVGLSAFATAQYSQDQLDVKPSGIALRVGGYAPFDSDTQHVGRWFYGLGADYTFPTQLLPGSQTFFSFEWLAKSFNGNHNSVFPVMLNQRFAAGKGLLGDHSYWFAGIGAVIFDVGSSKTVFGGRAGIGTEFKQDWFCELCGYISERDSGSGARMDGAALWLGYRF